MTPLAITVLLALLCAHLLELIADLCELRALRESPPPELEGLHSPQELERVRDYVRARIRLGRTWSAVELAGILCLWALGSFGWLDQEARALADGLSLGTVGAGLAFIAALSLVQGLAHLPFALWGTFRIEARFGFNRTSLRTFVSDRLKGLMLGVLLGAPLLALVLFSFERLGANAWPLAWALLAAGSVLLQLISPRWILPLFLRFEPLPEGETRAALLACSERAGFPLSEVSVVDGSRRSSKANAFFTGFGKSRRVALFDTLVERHPIGELVGVLAHEIGHWKLGHIPRGVALSLAESALWLYLLGLATESQALHSTFMVSAPSAHAGLVLLMILAAPLQLALGTIRSWISRRHEHQADSFAARTTGEPEALAQALLRMGSEGLSNPSPHPLRVALFASHPPLAERVRALRAGRAAGLPGG